MPGHHNAKPDRPLLGRLPTVRFRCLAIAVAQPEGRAHSGSRAWENRSVDFSWPARRSYSKAVPDAAGAGKGMEWCIFNHLARTHRDVPGTFPSISLIVLERDVFSILVVIPPYCFYRAGGIGDDVGVDEQRPSAGHDSLIPYMIP